MNPNKKNSELAEEAYERIDQKGWIQRAYVGPNGERCLVGSFVEGEGLTSEFGHASRVAKQVILPASEVLNGWQHDSIIDYNDCFLSCKEEVLDVLMRVAEYWRNKGE